MTDSKHDWLIAGAIVAVILGACAGLSILKVTPESVGDVLIAILIVPGGLVVLPFYRVVHDFDLGGFLTATFINWMPYTWFVWHLLQKRRLKKNTRSTQ